MQLDEVRRQIDQTLHTLESVFSETKTQEFLSLRRDRNYGTRSFMFRIVWDEFSPTTLRNLADRIEALHVQYRELRDTERAIMFDLQVQKTLESRNATGQPQP